MNKSPIPPAKVGTGSHPNSTSTRSRHHSRPPSVCSTIPFRSRNRTSDPTTKEYGNKFYTPNDKDFYKGVLDGPKTAASNATVSGERGLRQGLDDGSVIMSPSLSSLYTASLHSSMPFGSIVSEVDSSRARARERGDGELYLFSRLRTDTKVEHRAKVKNKMFVSGNTSYDKSGCGKLGFVELPTKDSMFESYRLVGSPVSRAPSPVQQDRIPGKVMSPPSPIMNSPKMRLSASLGALGKPKANAARLETTSRRMDDERYSSLSQVARDRVRLLQSQRRRRKK